MLSILIPTYNYDCSFLIKNLLDEASALDYNIEIIVADDYSDPHFRSQWVELKMDLRIKVYLLDKNIGRAAIRNYLASLANNEWLLFLDNDGIPEKPDFIKCYIDHFKVFPNAIICGGRTYSQSKPDNPLLVLHWIYGSMREVKSAVLRSKNPYSGFQSNNFCIPKAQFSKIYFDEHFKQYGHEDTAFGFKAKALNINIAHIDNPVLHLGLEDFDTFLQKTVQASRNAYAVYIQKGIILGRNISFFSKLEKFKLDYPAYLVLRLFADYLTNNLKGQRPTMRAFDLFKIYIILKMKFDEVQILR